MNLKVSVIIPVFNGFRWVASIIDSIQQNLSNIGELILINDGSLDDFLNLEKEIRKLSDFPISCFYTKGKEGPGIARNIGLDNVSFDFIAFLDTDDQWLPGSLEKRLDALVKSKTSPFVYSSYYRITPDGKITNITLVPDSANLESLFVTNFIATPSVIVRRSSLNKMRFKQIGHEDYDFWLRLIHSSGQAAIGVVEPVINVRTASGSVSSVKSNAAIWHFKILSDNCIPVFIRSLLFVGYALNGILKRKRYKYKPLFFGLNHLVSFWLSINSKRY
jgi:teichuronic acid biosynthesis glycosyltransferase TuaG